MPELLLELFSEEIPARMQTRAAEDLKRLVTEALKAAGLTWTRADAYVTPRRLALVVDGLPARTPDIKDERKGPRVGAPEQAIQGFLKGAGLTSLDQAEKRTVGKAEFWFAVVEKKGQETRAVVPSVVNGAIATLPWPKSMRWANLRARWVRPLQSVLCVFDGAVSGSVDLGGGAIAFNATSHGHRFLAPKPFTVTAFADYKTKLRDAHVILDQAERRALIDAETKRVAGTLGVTVRDDPGLLDEVTGLVEWPVVLAGTIDAAFMDLPAEVLTTSMRAHQKYFSCLKPDGALASKFLVVSNMDGDAELRATIVAGNERVLRARLSDAKFFWDQDRKVPLETRVPALAQRVFYQGLGTLADKVARLQTLAAELCDFVPGADRELVRAAALLAKADLTTGMVGEFPELQGVMGAHYARAENENPQVAAAIREHYQPVGQGDACPSAPVSVAVALADRLDTLAGFFAIDEKPTGSKDPFALRRAALGAIRLIVENKLRLPLAGAFAAALYGLKHQLKESAKLQAADPKAIIAALVAFFADRLKVALREQGVRHDLIDAVFALGGEDDIVRLLARVAALGEFLKSDDGANLLVAYRRAMNIVAIEAKKDGTQSGAPDAGLFQQDEEKALAAALDAARPEVEAAIKAENFAGAMRVLSRIRGPVDAFFDKVTVNAPEARLRSNRLRLLGQIGATLGAVADFAKIEG